MSTAPLGSAPVWRDAVRLAERAARTPAPVLLLGATGTGKEVLAQHIHRQSGRVGEMVPVNCGAIPAEHVEFELFGHAKGAYTGVTADARGYIREAEGGTLFLDEIGELPLSSQAKLLRVLQERRVRPMGGRGDVAVDFRLICATHRDLEAMVREGTFREDLWQRIAVVDIHLPRLADRREDIVPLAQHFLAAECGEYGRARATLGADAKRALSGSDLDWSGNVRELQRRVRKGLVCCADSGVITAADMGLDRAQQCSPERTSPCQTPTLDKSARRDEGLHLLAEGVEQAEVARRLGVTPTAVRKWAQKFAEGSQQVRTPDETN